MINVYRSFNPQNNVNAGEKFKNQLSLIKNAMTVNTIFVGDFNLDYTRVHDDNYSHKNLFLDFEDVLGDFNLIQQVRFATWSRIIGDELKESSLDHIYWKDPTQISNTSHIMP